MKALYTNEKILEKFEIKDLEPYNYESRKKASNLNLKFVHLFSSVIENEEVKYEYYSTLKMYI